MGMTLQEIRERYPQYEKFSDQEIADSLYQKYYSEFPRAQFDKAIGLTVPEPTVAPSQELRSDVIGGAYAMNLPTFAQQTQRGTLGGGAKEMVSNIPKSAYNFGRDIAQPFIDPKGTITNFKNLGQGILEYTGMMEGEDHKKYADAVGKYFHDRYGGWDNALKTLREDPVAIAADVAMTLSGGGAALRTASTLGRVGEVAGAAGRVAGAAGRAIDPLTVLTKAPAVTGRIAAGMIGSLGTQTGGEVLRTGARAGAEGGVRGREFLTSLGEAPGQSRSLEIVEAARGAVEQMRKERGDAYRTGMLDIKQATQPISFGPIARTMVEARKVMKFGTQWIEQPGTIEVFHKMQNAIANWRTLPGYKYHTAEGMDALKKILGSLRDDAEPGTRARLAADRVYYAVRNSINKQAPAYAKVMRAYEQASDLIHEIETSLSLGERASVDTALGKLQSVLRDNVNTRYGHRAFLANYLVSHGTPYLIEQMAGMALNSWWPRGLAKLVGGEMVAAAAGAVGAGITGAGASMLMLVPFMMPRVMGYGAYAAGMTQRVPGRAIMRGLFQTGRTAREPYGGPV